MKLFRFGEPGKEKPGVVLEDGIRIDASGACRDYDEEFFQSGGVGKLRAWANDHADSAPPCPEGVRLGPPVANPSKIVCVGMNYAAHAKEFANRATPSEPVLFLKAPSALCGPDDDLVRPEDALKLDYEVELAIVIGSAAKNVSAEDAAGHIAGYTMINDVSERAWQKERVGQWTKGKSADGFAPLGPFLVTSEEMEDVNALPLWLDVNGEPRQRGNTSDMVFDPLFLVSYISRYMTLKAGDIIATGTPSGVAMGMDPPAWLEPGDRIEMGIDGIGCSTRKVI